jgi:D-beta-D-heptose 7-phosphate kinase / D-beta-D-heptose 1-phosphate adenosyltransferase
MESNMGSTLIPWLDFSAKPKVLVIGDVILDEYIDGIVSRISPEAPVPIHHVQKRWATAGGAANVARNIQLCGGEAILLGVIGNDDSGTRLLDILKEDDVDVTRIIMDESRPTVRKTRITANGQQMMRVDWEDASFIQGELENKLLEQLDQIDFNCLLISDYGKGTLTTDLLSRLIKYANKNKKPVVVDPKGVDYSKYEGATLITPNRKEALEAANRSREDSIEAHLLAEELDKKYNIENFLITLGAAGMLLHKSGTSSHGFHLKSVAREVFDVSGAGDTVAALIALSLASQLSFEDSMGIANIAAGCVVEKVGTIPVNLDMLTKALQNKDQANTSTSLQQKIISIDHHKLFFNSKKTRTERLVFTNGCFDILHAGHITYLNAAKDMGDTLIVGLNSDTSVRRIKGDSRPINHEDHRALVLASLSCVDYVIIFDQDTPLELIKAVNPDILVKGADYAKTDIIGGDFVLDQGGKIETIELVQDLSTTKTIAKLRQ